MAQVQDKPAGFSDRLDSAIRRRHLTPSQAAQACGVSHQSFCRIVAGETNPTLETLVKISEGLDVSAEWLIWGRRSGLKG